MRANIHTPTPTVERTNDDARRVDALVEAIIEASQQPTTEAQEMRSQEQLLERLAPRIIWHETADLRPARTAEHQESLPELPGLQPGTLVQRRYRLMEVIAQGSTSIVYRAEHALLRKPVALKILRPEFSVFRSVVKRFRREAHMVSSLDHPNVVQVIDFGQTKDGSMYLVMELLEGETLTEKLRRESHLSPNAAVGICDQVLRGLAAAHRAGLVHRDLKPDNIMLIRKGGQTRVKILDFGCAKLHRGTLESTSLATQAGVVLGTPRYMSPEQASGGAADLRSDLYSVGVLLYEMLTGTPPFIGETPREVIDGVLYELPPPMDLGARVGRKGRLLQHLTMRALSKNKSKRFASAGAFRCALERWRSA